MKLSIARCCRCNRARLVDNVNGRWICFACKQRLGKQALQDIKLGAAVPSDIPMAAKAVLMR
jgi:ribosomal protein L37AE/L43A